MSSTTRREAPLALDSEQFRALGHRLVDTIAERLAAIPNGPVTRGETPAQVRAALGLGGPLPEQGEDPAALLERTAKLLFEHSLFNGHPKFFGYITSSPAPIGMLGDLLAAAVNANVGGYMLSPAATEVEAETVRWIAEFIGYPTTAGGLLVSGGNMANFVGFFAARAAKAPWKIRAEGAVGAGGQRLRAYTSAETHTWIQKAADLSGIGTDAVRWIPTGPDLRMDLAALRKAIADDRKAGDVPFLVAGTAGSVSTGAVDDLPGIARLCKEEDLWFHVDGAYGGFAAALPDAPADLKALSEADSVAVDPHKWLYAPLEAGCALVRDPAHLINAFSYHPPYYHLDEALNFVDYGMQNSRGFRALKVWLQFRQVGAAGYRRMMGDDVRLARSLDAAVRLEGELEPFTCDLSIATFRFVPADLRARLTAGDAAVVEYVDALNQALNDRLQKGGEAFVSNAVIGGRYVLRACIVNFRTEQADIDALPGIVVRVGRGIDRELRPAPLS
jgi:glutamate/tyrosine decarboxylase-like PLP-dependent enzyme